MLFPLLFLFETHGFNASLGFFSTKENPFMSASLFGIHSCISEEEGEKIKIIRHLGESRVDLNFKDTEDGKITHCKFNIKKKKNFQNWKKIMEMKPYLSFYSGNTWTKSNAFISEPNGTAFFSHYTIYFATNSSPRKPVFQVTPSNPVLISNSSEIEVSFQMDFSDSKLDEGTEKEHFPVIYIIIFIACVVLAVLFRFLLASKFKTISVIDINSVWAAPKNLPNEAVFAFFGLAILCSAVFSLFLINDEQNVIISSTYCVLFGIVFPVVARVIFDKIYGGDVYEPNFVALTLFIPFFFFMPYIFVQYFLYFFYGYNISLGIFRAAYIVGIMLVYFFEARAVGHISGLYKVSFVVDVNSESNKKKSRINGFANNVMCVIYGIGVTTICAPLFSHILDIILDFVPPNLELIYKTILLYGSVSIVYSLVRTFMNIKYDASWTAGQVNAYFVAALPTIIITLYDIFAERQIKSLASLLFALSGVLSNVGIITGIGSGFSFLTSFTIIYSIFTKTK